MAGAITTDNSATSYKEDGTPIYDNATGKSARYAKKDGVYFHIKDDLRLLLYLTANTDIDIDSSMSVTVQPMQSGETITDNYLRSPRIATITGVVVSTVEGTILTQTYNKNAEAFTAIAERWRDQKRILTLVCPHKQRLQNCVITKLSMKKDSSIENGLKIVATFQEVILKTNIGKTSISASGKRASKAGTASKKQVGNTATTTGSSPSACQGLKTAYDNGLEKLNSTQKRLLANCIDNKSFGTKGTYSTTDDKAVSDYYKRHAGNPNSEKGIGTR